MPIEIENNTMNFILTEPHILEKIQYKPKIEHSIPGPSAR